MNLEQLEKGQALKEKIFNLKEQKQKWEKSTMFDYDTKLYVGTEYNNGSQVSRGFINFDLLKTLTLDTINKELTKAEAELESL